MTSMTSLCQQVTHCHSKALVCVFLLWKSVLWFGIFGTLSLSPLLLSQPLFGRVFPKCFHWIQPIQWSKLNYFKKIAGLEPTFSCVRGRDSSTVTWTQLTEKTVKLILVHASVDSLNLLNSVNSENFAPFRENPSVSLPVRHWTTSRRQHRLTCNRKPYCGFYFIWNENADIAGENRTKLYADIELIVVQKWKWYVWAERE